MYRVLIVDDEEDVLKGIGKAVSDMHLFDEVDLESDPLAAEEAFSRKKYQVVISDICMEGEDGFEMIERIRTFSGNAKFVILTAYSDYEFMHRALKLGVDDYVLKPINKAAFTACLSKIRSELDEAQRAWKLKIYKEGAAAAELPEGEFAAIASYDAKLRKNAEGTVGASGVEILWVREESPFEYLLCGEREGCERETERLLSGVSFAAVTPTAAGDGLGKLRRELYGALQYRPFLQSGVVRTDRRAERTEWGTYRGYLESLKRLFSEGVHGMEVPEKLLSGLFSAGLADYGPEVLGQIKDETDFLFRARFGEDLRECALRDFSSAEEIVRRYLGILERNAEGRPYGYGKMAKALAYIDGHVTEKIDLAYVANLVDLNYYYFSRYFKRETGMKFLDYITEKRMLLAAKLLADPHRKVYEISAMLGYEDEKYFFKLFKKHYGISPQNFRANIDRKIRKGPDSAEPDCEEKK